MSLPDLLREIRACTLCSKHLPLGPRPVLRASASARLLIVGQAPGMRVHESGIPWNDSSGIRLRHWLGIDREHFYDESRIAIVPMGFCYPGTGASGDLAPRPECAQTWHPQLIPLLTEVRLTVLIGSYAQNHFLGPQRRKTLTETVLHAADYLPRFLPIPHPSPRNLLWIRSNPWFEAEIVPLLRREVAAALEAG